MTGPVLHYIYDPLCGWCYAAEPLLNAAHESGIEITFAGGNLFPEPTTLPAAKRQAIREADRRIGSMTGQPFGTAYVDVLLNDPASTWWSQPTIAAMLAAQAIDPGSSLRMLKAIQNAHYVEGRRVSDVQTLLEIAQEVGFDRQAFADAYAGVPLDQHVQATRSLMAREGVHGFPSFLLEDSGKSHRIPHEAAYGNPEAFVAALREAVR